MDIYRNFYRHLYFRTGFMVGNPLHQPFLPGDFFQIHQGETILLGNFFRSNLIGPADVKLDYGQKLNESSWNFSDGVSKPYSGRGSGHSPLNGEFEFSKQVLAFAQAGSFLFRGKNPETVKISNWNDIQQELIIKFTQTLFSFRELYVVTECATTSEFTMAIAGSQNAELELATDAENFGLVDIFGHEATKTLQSRDIECYTRETNRKPLFFKAKKLVVQEERNDVFVNRLISQSQGATEWARKFFDYDFHHDDAYSPYLQGTSKASMLDMLQGNELNPNSALLYFKWADANLDDVAKLFSKE